MFSLSIVLPFLYITLGMSLLLLFFAILTAFQRDFEFPGIIVLWIELSFKFWKCDLISLLRLLILILKLSLGEDLVLASSFISNLVYF